MTAEFDQLVAEFEQFQAQIQNMDDRFEHLAGMQSELATLEVTASTPDHSITVVAGPGGSVRDIRITEDAFRLGPEQLSSELMATLREAVADAARQQAGIVEEFAGGPVLDQVLETQSELTGVPVAELREKVHRPGDSYLRDFSEEED
ncbi:YbaB/EbfC family nucleoid-associated protein [Actinophytocola oryzae]|uniref:DNA-binding protein YbaB n=1 Tax=Actinophytocola oryzae TaxID=502181 RepID=A0A4V3FTF6_9PSEU|nr:YbaB/EbfC family nucleoid-associated protein [Actinophytocola oryzae]TDV51001.1 DNA-binding protein YbaB [Actinophytocola oryzae]